MTSTRTTGRVLATDVSRRINALQRAFLDELGPAAQSQAQGDLAALRRTDPLEPADPSVWNLTLAESPEDLLGGNDASVAERVRHAVMALYGRHQQSHRVRMHLPGASVGTAVRALGRARAREGGGELDPAVRSRFDAALRATSLAGRVEHLKTLIAMMRTEEPPIPLDYGLLAADLHQMENPARRAAVQLRWGRDLYRSSKPDTPSDPANPTTPIEGAPS